MGLFLGPVGGHAGIDGLIVSPHEAARMRALLGPDMIIITPGVRPVGADLGDQKRVMTPAEAISEGADHVVVGRPIHRAADPRAAALAILDEMRSPQARHANRPA